jgi:hypothetical protein
MSARERTFELRLAGGKVVLWDGETEEDAAQRYIGSHPDAVVVATRMPTAQGTVRIWGGALILEPGDKRWKRAG